MRTIIGEIYTKDTDEKVCNLIEDENGRMWAIGYVGTTLKELMDYCNKWDYTYQLAFGDMPEPRNYVPTEEDWDLLYCEYFGIDPEELYEFNLINGIEY